MSSSDEDERKKDVISEMFGEDSDDSDAEQSRNASSAPVTADTSGLFGSDSESDDDAHSKPLKKKNKAPSSLPPAKRKKFAERKLAAQASSGDNKIRKREERASGDEYDSGEEVSQTKDDDDFIDKEDDLADVLGEYDEDRQNFEDERPVEEELKHSEPKGDFFDETLKSLKSGRRSKLNMSVQEMEQVAQELLYQMDKAWADDQANIGNGKPAFEKIKFTDKALYLMRKQQLQPMLLDFDILSIVKKWISPLEDGALPNVGMRTKMLQMTSRLPIYKEHLKRSGFGKAIMTLWKHPEETPGNKEICRELIERWSRSVFNKTLDYSKLSELEAEKVDSAPYRRPDKQKNSNASSRNSSGSNFFRSKQDATHAIKAENSERARLPQQLRFDFLHRPQPKLDVQTMPSKKMDPESRRGRLAKRMQEIAKPGKKSKRAIPMEL